MTEKAPNAMSDVTARERTLLDHITALQDCNNRLLERARAAEAESAGRLEAILAAARLAGRLAEEIASKMEPKGDGNVR